MKWITLFSQTGSEIVVIGDNIKRKPSLIVTNNRLETEYRYNSGLRELGTTIVKAKHDQLMDYLMTSSQIDPKNTVITLHGYLRIIPPEVCERFEIYNGHPAPIEEYPELKGKDPQKRIWQNKGKYNIIGSVVHRVTAGVDEGEVVSKYNVPNRLLDEGDTFATLRMTSLVAWQKFLNKRFEGVEIDNE